MKNVLFPRDWIKLTPTKRTKLEEQKKKLEDKQEYQKRELNATKSELSTLDIVFNVDDKRELIAKYWDSVPAVERKVFGKSQDPDAISPITFEHVGDKSWKELDEYWQGTFLAMCSSTSVEYLESRTVPTVT